MRHNLSNVKVKEFRNDEAVNRIGHLIAIPATPEEHVRVWESHAKTDEWLLIANNEKGETWVSLVTGSDNEDSRDIVVQLVREYIIGSIIDNPDPERIQVLKHSDSLGYFNAYNVAGIAVQTALDNMDEADIPAEFTISLVQ